MLGAHKRFVQWRGWVSSLLLLVYDWRVLTIPLDSLFLLSYAVGSQDSQAQKGKPYSRVF